ncbi:MAG: pyridoxal-phosphate dependent enzyme [Burkholderiaceae bacterium]
MLTPVQPQPDDSPVGHEGLTGSFQPGPTPLCFLPRFSSVVGTPVYIKQDDAGPISWAGTKARKIRRILDQARQAGIELLVMCGPAQSNSCRALAAGAAAAGIKVILLLRGKPPSEFVGNLKIIQSLGTEIRWAGDLDWPRLELQARQLVLDLQQSGVNALEIPTGCSSVDGVIAILEAGAELQAQCDALGLRPATIVHASASGGMHAGLAISSVINRSPPPHSVMIVRDIYDDVEGHYADLILRTVRQIKNNQVIRYLRTPQIDWSQLGGGYGSPTRKSEQAAQLLARTEGLLVEPVYTGKALAAVIDRASEQPGSPIVFWHSGGIPAYFLDSGAAPIGTV